MGLRRSLRSAEGFNRRTLGISDSLVSICAYAKGQASNALNTLCRRAAALRLGGQVQWRLRYVETDRNPSDRDSMRWG